MPYFRMSYSLDNTIASTSGHVMQNAKHHNGRHQDHDRPYGNQIASTNGSTNGEPPLRRTDVNNVTEELANYLLDMLVLDSCFEVHQEASLLHDAHHSVDALDPDPRQVTLSPVHSYIPLRPMNADEVVVSCPECSKAMSVKVFAQHLDHHSGGGRNSSRTARKRMAEEQQLNNLRLGSSDDEAAEVDPRLMSPVSNDDDDWQMSKAKKRRPNPKTKKKR